MKISVEINNQSQSPVRGDFFANVMKKTLMSKEFDFLRKKEIGVSVALVGKKEIKAINRQFRKKNEVTDVLSFAEYKNLGEIMKAKDKRVFLGEIILCYNDIARYAKKLKKNIKQELAQVVSHGILHLLGFAHGKKMFEIQEKAAGVYQNGKSKTIR